MKKHMKLTHKLIRTIIILSLGSIVAFCIILPTSIRYFLDNKMYNALLKEEEQYRVLGRFYNEALGRQDGIYLMKFNEKDQLVLEEIDDEFVHQSLMYKDFFNVVSQKVKKQVRSIETYKYTVNNDTIYYLINSKEAHEKVVFYSIDSNNQHLSFQLFMNALLIITVVLGVILISFFRWNARLINHLKAVQLSLNRIGEGNLEEAIKSEQSIVEFEEVMHALEHMRQRLYENNQVKQQMLHNISHDMKTPLAVIKNYAEGVMDGVYPYGTVEETALVIYNQADRLQKKVQSLLYLNRLEYIKSQSEVYSYFNMKDLVTEVVDYMQDREERLEVKMQLDEVLFYGDVDKWRIVLENLVDNAKRYAKSRLEITLSEEELSLYNDGEAIEESIYGSLFEPFEVGQGGVSGLGLAIVKKTVELYHYHIHFKNEEKGGVTFTIYK